MTSAPGVKQRNAGVRKWSYFTSGFPEWRVLRDAAAIFTLFSLACILSHRFGYSGMSFRCRSTTTTTTTTTTTFFPNVHQRWRKRTVSPYERSNANVAVSPCRENVTLSIVSGNLFGLSV